MNFDSGLAPVQFEGETFDYDHVFQNKSKSYWFALHFHSNCVNLYLYYVDMEVTFEK